MLRGALAAAVTPLRDGGDALDEAVDYVVGELLGSGPEAARAAKQLIRERPGGEAAARTAARLRTSAEGQEGLRAFLEKRSPAWRD